MIRSKKNHNKAKKVYMVVHNSVLKDARVLKESRTLANAGFFVTIFGIGSKERLEYELHKNIRVILCIEKVKIFRLPNFLSTVSQAIQKLSLKLFNLDISDHRFLNIERNVARIKRLINNAFLFLIFGFGKVQEKNIYSSYKSTSDILFLEVLKHGKPDILHLHDTISLVNIKNYREKFNCPIIWDAHEIYEELGASKKALLINNQKIIKEATKFIDAFITINVSISKFYKTNYISLPKATIIKNATNNIYLKKYDNRLHRKAELPSEKKILLFQGGFAKDRGLEELIDASRFLNDKWAVVMMGWGSLEEHLKILANKYNLIEQKKVSFIPPVEHKEITFWTQGATIGIIPYKNTGLNHLYCTPNKLWEYPVANVPILVSPLVELTNAVKNHKIGFLLDASFDGKSIARVVNSITNQELNKARENCRKYILNDNWDIYGKRLIKLYKKLLK